MQVLKMIFEHVATGTIKMFKIICKMVFYRFIGIEFAIVWRLNLLATTGIPYCIYHEYIHPRSIKL